MASATVPQLVADLARAFPRQPVTVDTVRVYVRGLDDIPPGVLEQAVLELIRTSLFFPTVAEIRQAAAERTLALPTETAALGQLHDRQEWARLNEDDRPAQAPPCHALVLRAVHQVGGWHAFRAADKAEVVRGQFLRLYRELRAEAVRGYQVGRELAPGRPLPELEA